MTRSPGFWSGQRIVGSLAAALLLTVVGVMGWQLGVRSGSGGGGDPLAYRTSLAQFVAGEHTRALDTDSFALSAGEVAQLRGSSGAGKSTAVRLLLGLLAPSPGVVRVNGLDLESVGRASVRRAVAYAGQRVLLFAGTVAENIRLGAPNTTDDALREAAWLADADRFIDALPEGYRTPLGERGLGLSGGQQQRIALARALVKPASVLILDEALSGVESEAQARILARIQERRPGLMVVWIAHAGALEAGRAVTLFGGTDADVKDT